jgi:beta-galactosidase
LKDNDNSLVIARQPAPLVRLLGARVDDYYPIDATVKLDGSTLSGTAHIWAETLEVMPATIVLARYSPQNNWLSNKPAFAMRTKGKS